MNPSGRQKSIGNTPGKSRSLAAAILFLVIFFICARFTSCSPALFLSRREHLADIVIEMFPPDVSFLKYVIAPLTATVRMSVTGTFLGAFLALVAAPYAAAGTDSPAPVRIALRLAVQILRSFPAMILALAAAFLFGLGTFAGTVAITVYTFAVMTRLTYEDIESAPLAAYRALRTMGASHAAAVRRAVWPEIAHSYLTNALYLMETNVRHGSILGLVGAGGIGILLNEKISWREYDKVSVILIMLFLTICVIELITGYLVGIVNDKINVSPLGKRLIYAAIAAFFLLSVLTEAGPDLSHTSMTAVRNMLYGLTHPDWGFFFERGESGLMYLLAETAAISLVGTSLGAALAVPLSLLGSERLVPAPVAALFGILVMAIRSVPFMIYGLIFIRVVGPGAFAGVLTLSLCSLGLLFKRFTSAIAALDLRPYYALRNMGVSAPKGVVRAVLPALKGPWISACFYRFDINIREASILGLVGAGGIGAPLIFSMNHFAWSETGAIALGLIIMVWIVDRLSTGIRLMK